jgi:putative tryptophan/tyrosine transport system substrate-binding protein
MSEIRSQTSEIEKAGQRAMTKKIILLALCSLLLAPCSAVDAQQAAKVRTIGFLGQSGGPLAAYEVFRHALRDRGYIEGTNIAMEYRRSDEGGSSLADKATELVRMKVDVIVTTGGASTRAVQQATTTIPIVFTSSGDPIESGFIDSLARPGKNLTGITFLAYELVGKRLELLKEAAPKVSRVAVIANPAHPGEQRELSETQSIARALGITLEHHQVISKANYDTAFGAILREKANGLLVFPEGTTLANVTQIVEFAAKHRLPSMFGWKEYIEGGGLMAYGPNRDESYKRIAVYVDKILKGTKPTDVPTEQPTKFELIINLKTAKQIGLTIPPNVLARADKVIK